MARLKATGIIQRTPKGTHDLLLLLLALFAAIRAKNQLSILIWKISQSPSHFQAILPQYGQPPNPETTPEIPSILPIPHENHRSLRRQPVQHQG